MSDCLFCKIAAKEMKADIVYENEKVIAFNDINPQAPVHIVIIPKKHIATLNDVDDYSVYTDIFKAVSILTKEKGIRENGYRIVANCNRNSGQTIFHIHFHLLGGRVFRWPPG